MSAAIFMARRAISSADSPSIVDQRAGRGQRVVAAGADGDHAVLRLQHVAVAGEGEAAVLVGHRHHRLQPAQVAVGAPVLRQLDAGAFELAGEALELGLQPLEQGEGVGRGAGEAGQHGAARADAAHFAGVALDDGLSKADLAVPGHGHVSIPPDAQDGGAVPPDRVGGGELDVLHDGARWRVGGRAARRGRGSNQRGG